MTTTVIRGKSGALLRIPTGARRMNRRPLVGDSVVAFINEASHSYYDPSFPPEHLFNVEGRALWSVDVAAFMAVNGALIDADILVPSQVMHITDGVFSEVIRPPMDNYPEGLSVKAMLKFPDLERFAEEVTSGGEFVPFVFLLDDSGSMYEAAGGYLLSPGLGDYVSNPPTGLEPRVEVFGTAGPITDPLVERWLFWIVTELEALIPSS